MHHLDHVLLLATVAATLSFGRTPVAERTQSEPSKKPCCFKNSGYAGTCKVQPAGDETCASILAYLNNPMAEGKSYCGGTTVRQAWTEVSWRNRSERKSSGPGRPDRSTW
jgi:hypothetical protein